MLVVAALGLAPTAASASPDSVVCTGTDDATFHPGLRTFSRTVEYSETIEGTYCAGLGKITGDNTFDSGFGGTADLSCTALFGPIMFTQEFTWSPSGRTSTWTAQFGESVYVDGQLVATATGPITDGDYSGATMTLVAAYPTTQLIACLSSPGLTSIHGTMTWTLTDL
jgi:hypothetical protein